MKITIIDKKSGLEVGKQYELCDMATKNLIGNGYAVEYIAKEVVTEKVISKKEKTDGKKTK